MSGAMRSRTASGSDPPEPGVAAPAARGRRSASAPASVTLSTAVPIDAPTCWRMLMVVLARATAARRSVCIAPDMIGIIVEPRPMPITKRITPSVQ